MRVLRRRAAAMSPREKHLAIISALGVVGFALYYIPTFLYATLILAVCCIACYYHSGEPLPARLGLNPRTGFNVPVVLRRWLRGWGVTGVSAATQGRTKSSRNKTELRDSEGHSRERFGETGIYRRETLESDSFIFSPRDFLMGSYIGKPESPTADSGRPRAGRNPREQLREKLSRPNHAVYTPNRRLSFAGYVRLQLKTITLPTSPTVWRRYKGSISWRVFSLATNCEEVGTLFVEQKHTLSYSTRHFKEGTAVFMGTTIIHRRRHKKLYWQAKVVGLIVYVRYKNAFLCYTTCRPFTGLERLKIVFLFMAMCLMYILAQSSAILISKYVSH